ncbi:MAG TPA: glycosyltransferase [Magnetospirillaceae bacterium]|nr:glycosyltransferase [Magnetospirillaceae bacterium]
MPSDRLTIGMFADSYLPEINGVVTSLVSSTRELRRRGHRVIVIAPSHEGAVDDDPDVFRLRSSPFPFYPQFRMAFPLPAKLLATLPRMPFDVIHVHSMFFIGCLGAYLAQFRRMPLVFTYHTLWTEYAHYVPVDPGFTRAQAVWVSREFCNRATRVIAPTHGIRTLLATYGVNRPATVLPSGVDVSVFELSVADAPRIRAGGGPIALFVGRLGKEKNVDLVLDAFDVAARRIPDLRLIVVGSGPHEEALRRHANELASSPRIRFTGALDQRELGAYYAAADAFVFASTTETQGLVLLEAMTHGVPVAAVDCPVSREVVAGESGLLCAERASELGEALVALVRAGEDERARRIASAKNVARPYSLEALTDKLEEQYAQVCTPSSAAL